MARSVIKKANSSEYGLDSGCELKRRMTTRNGNPLTAKLANDIHSLLLVLKGEGLTYIKDMIIKHSQEKCVKQCVWHPGEDFLCPPLKMLLSVLAAKNCPCFRT